MTLDPAAWEALRVSLEVSAAATALVAVPAVALGRWLAGGRSPARLLVDVAVHLPLVLTPVVVGYLLLLLLGREGPFGPALEAMGLRVAFTRAGAVLAAAVVALPLVVRTSRAAFEQVDPRLEEAASLLGAGPARRLVTVALPLAAPGIVAGLVLGFARAVGEFGATVTFAGSLAGETRTLPIAIFEASQAPGGEGVALSLALLSVGLSSAALVAGELLLGRLAAGRGGGSGR